MLDANFAKANKASATGSSQSTNAANGSSNPKAIIQVPRINLTTSISETMITISLEKLFLILRYDFSS